MSDENVPTSEAATPAPEPTPTPAPVITSFNLSDVFAIPIETSAPVSKSFTAKGRDWPVTITTDGKTNADTFFRQFALMTSPSSLKLLNQWEPQVINVPSGPPTTVSDPDYWGKLLLLASVSTSPKFTAEEWAIFADRVGPSVVDEVINWACTENGITEHYARLFERAKKNLSAADGE